MFITTWSQAQTIDTFPLEEWVGTSSLHVGADGDIWFTLNEPQRLMHVVDDQIECAYDSGTQDVQDPGPYDIAITPDGAIWLSHARKMYCPEAGFLDTDFELPVGNEYCWFAVRSPTLASCDCALYIVASWDSSFMGKGDDTIYELVRGAMPEIRYRNGMGRLYLDSVLIVSSSECWAYASAYFGGSFWALWRINLEAGALDAEYGDPLGLPCAKDSQGLLWLRVGPSIVTFDGESSSVFAEGHEEELWYREPVLAADGAVWSVEADDYRSIGTNYFGISRFTDGQKRTFTVDDGLLSNWCDNPVIDYDGRLWLLNREFVYPYARAAGLSRITDGGWPPMRLMLNRLETPESIAVEAQVINNGPVVGVDVYLALQVNGQLLFWPNWQPAPSPVQVNLRPGHNQTATIISAPRSSIPPGTYTFWGCMTGRNTQKLIGPLDRKFESLAIQID
jgi:hypothetical protein